MGRCCRTLVQRDSATAQQTLESHPCSPSPTPAQHHSSCISGARSDPRHPGWWSSPWDPPPIPTLIHCAEGKGSLLPQLRVFLQLRGVTGQGYSGSKWHHSVSC